MFRSRYPLLLALALSALAFVPVAHAQFLPAAVPGLDPWTGQLGMVSTDRLLNPRSNIMVPGSLQTFVNPLTGQADFRYMDMDGNWRGRATFINPNGSIGGLTYAPAPGASGNRPSSGVFRSGPVGGFGSSGYYRQPGGYATPYRSWSGGYPVRSGSYRP